MHNPRKQIKRSTEEVQSSIHYPKAPITEAIIDIRTRLKSNAGLEDLEVLHELIEDQYPNKVTRNLAQGHFEVGAKVSASAHQHPIGFLFKSRDDKQIFQARLDGFTLSRLAPYESWDLFREEARGLWNLYRKQADPEEVTRIAVRYINRIDIPHPVGDLNQYLRTFPEVSSDLPQMLSGLFMQLTIPQPEIESVILLNEALVEPSTPSVASIVLDIDLFRETNVPQVDAEMWDFFEILRVRKNEAFEACITDLTRKLFL